MFSTVARFPSPGARAPSPPHRVGRGVRARGRRPAHPRTRARAAIPGTHGAGHLVRPSHTRAGSGIEGAQLLAREHRGPPSHTRAGGDRRATPAVSGIDRPPSHTRAGSDPRRPRDRLAYARAATGPALDRHLRPHRLACAQAAVRPPSRSAAADIVTARGGTLASHRARKRRQRTPRAPAGGDRPPDKGVRRAHVGHLQPTNDAVGRDASPLAMQRSPGRSAGRRRSQCSGAFATGRQYTHPAPRA